MKPVKNSDVNFEVNVRIALDYYVDYVRPYRKWGLALFVLTVLSGSAAAGVGYMAGPAAGLACVSASLTGLLGGVVIHSVWMSEPVERELMLIHRYRETLDRVAPCGHRVGSRSRENVCESCDSYDDGYRAAVEEFHIESRH